MGMTVSDTGKLTFAGSGRQGMSTGFGLRPLTGGNPELFVIVTMLLPIGRVCLC